MAVTTSFVFTGFVSAAGARSMVVATRTCQVLAAVSLVSPTSQSEPPSASMHPVIVFVTALPLVKANVASPLSAMSSPLAGTGVPPPVTTKWTSSPSNGLPKLSVTVAVTV